MLALGEGTAKPLRTKKAQWSDTTNNKQQNI